MQKTLQTDSGRIKFLLGICATYRAISIYMKHDIVFFTQRYRQLFVSSGKSTKQYKKQKNSKKTFSKGTYLESYFYLTCVSYCNFPLVPNQHHYENCPEKCVWGRGQKKSLPYPEKKCVCGGGIALLALILSGTTDLYYALITEKVQ